MRTTLLPLERPGESLRPIADRLLVERLSTLHRAAPRRGALGALRLGIEDDRGRVVRVIETTSVVEAVGIFEALRDLHFEPGPGRREDGVAFARVYRAPSTVTGSFPGAR